MRWATFMLKVHTVYLSLGTNLGDKEHNLLSAITEIERRIGPVRAQSAFLSTEPWGMGRTEKSTINGQQSTVTYHDRIIDIDILLYDDLHINTPKLTIPHPHMYERDFVLIPLREILPQKELKQ